MYYIIYKTTNLINGKYYIGRHQTNCLEDGYLGSGSSFSKALKKYGRKNFKREIISFCQTEEEMINLEKQIVSIEVVKDPMSYNLIIGGHGGVTGEKAVSKRKVENRPSKEELSILIETTPFVQIGKMFGVTDNAVRKWAKNYGLSTRGVCSFKGIGETDQKCLNCGKIFHDDYIHDFCSQQCFHEYTNPLFKMSETELMDIIFDKPRKEIAQTFGISISQVKEMRLRLRKKYPYLKKKKQL